MSFIKYCCVMIASLFFAAAYATSENERLQSLHLDWIDKSVHPGENFFAYANGNWLKNNSIPAAYSRWGMFDVLRDKNQLIIKNILISASANNFNKPGSIEQKVGDFYFSGMNELAINTDGVKPLEFEFDRITTIKNLTDFQAEVAHLHLIGVNAVFDFGKMQDFKDSSQMIGVASQGGLGLPDRDYYLKNDNNFKKVRESYQSHIAKMLELLGDEPTIATLEAQSVLRIETELAKLSMSRIAQRNPHAVYHVMMVPGLQKLTPSLIWSEYFANIGHSEIQRINLAMPDFFKGVNGLLTSVSINDWKIYLRWHLLQSYSSYLSQPFIDENFKMAALLTGAKEMLPRWKRVESTEEGVLGFAIGKLYIEKNFSPASKQYALVLLKNIRAELRKNLSNLSWMTAATRHAAIKKLDLMQERVGYPDKWRDYSALIIDRGPYVLNVLRANQFLVKRELNKIGKPIDKSEWDMLPQEVNAYYDPSMNRLNIPAGILQAPFFDVNAPSSVNYGGIGFVMGHEMTHGFDDQGAQFDGHGNLNNWWSKSDLSKFKKITDGIATQFSAYKVNDHLHVQGKLVTGEATADLGGLTLAYRAFHQADVYKQSEKVGGFSPDQQFFLGAAHVWATNIRPEEAQRRVLTDPHPPALYRVNGTLLDLASFKTAFNLNDVPLSSSTKQLIW